MIKAAFKDISSGFLTVFLVLIGFGIGIGSIHVAQGNVEANKPISGITIEEVSDSVKSVVEDVVDEYRAVRDK